VPALAQRFGVSEIAIRAAVEKGDLPQPDEYVGGTAPIWDEATVDAWVAHRPDFQLEEYYDLDGLTRRLNVKKSTLQVYRSKGIFPEPDLLTWWSETTIANWQASRRGQGWRRGKRGGWAKATD